MLSSAHMAVFIVARGTTAIEHEVDNKYFAYCLRFMDFYKNGSMDNSIHHGIGHRVCFSHPVTQAFETLSYFFCPFCSNYCVRTCVTILAFYSFFNPDVEKCHSYIDAKITLYIAYTPHLYQRYSP